MDKLRLFGIAVIFFAALASPALAGKTTYTADLKGSFEVPPPDSTAKGKSDLTYDNSTKTSNLDYHLFGSQRKGDSRPSSWTSEGRRKRGPMITLSPLASR